MSRRRRTHARRVRRASARLSPIATSHDAGTLFAIHPAASGAPHIDLNTTKIYRVSVYAGINGTLLGYADVQPVSSGSGLKNVDTEEYIGLKDGRTLPIKFRIETGIVGSLTVEPVEAEAEPGATQQFIAIASDLHGNLMSADVTWASSDEAVATVDQTGLATAVNDGAANITATSQRIVGTATLTVQGGGLVITARASHTCLLDETGRAYCWGAGLSGQLGKLDDQPTNAGRRLGGASLRNASWTSSVVLSVADGSFARRWCRAMRLSSS